MGEVVLIITQVDCIDFWCFIFATNYTNLH